MDAKIQAPKFQRKRKNEANKNATETIDTQINKTRKQKKCIKILEKKEKNTKKNTFTCFGFAFAAKAVCSELT